MNKIKSAFICAICGLFVQTTFSQTIELYFPYFAGRQFDFILMQGSVNDTVLRGKIGGDGRQTLNIPEKYEGYAGMARWMLKGGGGLDFVVNGKNFSVSCTERNPGDETIIYKNSAENDFLRTQFVRQQNLLRKANALGMTLDAYKDDVENPLYEEVWNEFDRQKALFRDLVGETRQTNLYAARYRRIFDFYKWFPLYEIYGGDIENEEKLLNDTRRFVSEELDVDALYTSGLWNAVISQTFDLYPDKAGFGDAMIELLKRTKSERIFERFATDLVTITTQYNWAEAEDKIVSFVQASGRVKYPDGLLERAFAMQKTKAGTKAPVLSQGKFPKGNTLLIFYEMGCNHCENEIQQLKNRYSILKERGYEVISVSADLDLTVFENSASLFPWKQKYCDGEGLTGKDFQNYGVVGTPTLYVIADGIIKGRYARFADTGIL